MADRYRRSADMYGRDTDGGEAEPRPLKSQRLVDMVEGTKPASPRMAEKQGGGTVSREPRKAPPAVPSVQPSPVLLSASESEPTAMPASIPDFASDTCSVLSVTPAGEGETVTVVLAMPAPTGGKMQRVSFHLLVEQYAELGVKTGAVTSEEADALLDAGRLCGAIRRGMALLQYGDQSARRLVGKLTAKGIQRETAESAAAYLVSHGYIREEDTAFLRAEQGLRKGWGPRRIREDLRAHGFTPEAVNEAMETLSEVEWAEICAAALEKKYGDIPAEKAERQKLMAAMMRLGYDADTVKEAMRVILRKK